MRGRARGRAARPDNYDRCPQCTRWKRKKSQNCARCDVRTPNAGSWQKGDPRLIGLNHKPIGSKRLNTKSGEIHEKVSDQNPWLPGTGSGLWVARRKKNWEDANGPVPDGLIIRRLTDDPLDDDPEHMVLISRAVNVSLNQGRWAHPRRPWHKLPADIASRRLGVLAAIAHTIALERQRTLPPRLQAQLRNTERRRRRADAG